MISDILAVADATGHMISVCLHPEGRGWILSVGFDSLPSAYDFGRQQTVGTGGLVYKADDNYAIVSVPVQVRSERPHPLVTQRWDLRSMSQADAQWALGLYKSL